MEKRPTLRAVKKQGLRTSLEARRASPPALRATSYLRGNARHRRRRRRSVRSRPPRGVGRSPSRLVACNEFVASAAVRACVRACVRSSIRAAVVRVAPTLSPVCPLAPSSRLARFLDFEPSSSERARALSVFTVAYVRIAGESIARTIKLSLCDGSVFPRGSGE